MQVEQPLNPADLATRAKPAPSTPTGDPPAETASAVADVSQIAGTLMQAAPDVQPAAIREHQNQAKAESTKDRDGVSFDETIHARGSDGKPQKTAAGTWAKRRGRKAGGAAKPANVAGSVLAGGGQAMVDSGAAARTAGAQAANLLVALGMMIGGDEWAPIVIPDKGIDEGANLQKAFGDYFVATNRKDLPPGVVLSFVVLAYAAPRCFRPTTRERLGLAKAWIIDKARRVYVWYRGKRD